MLTLALLLVGASPALGAAAAGGADPRTEPRPVVIAVVGEAGLNLLHQDFRSSRTWELPAGAPKGRVLHLPTSGSYESRVASARASGLGALPRDTLVRLRGNRIAAVVAPSNQLNEFGTASGYSGSDPVDVFADTGHGTGVASAAVSARHGTAPDAVVVMVLGGGDAAWQWVAEQPWIDLVSASYVLAAPGASTPADQTLCPLYRGSQATVKRGAFIAVANGNDPGFGSAFAPASFPGLHHVGGVTHDGQPVLLDAAESGNITTKVGPDRPYDSGELFSFTASDANSLDGERTFGGTSGATPRLVGHAARLVATARHLLGDRGVGTRDGALALLGKGRRPPASGPLADGRFTADELGAVLRATSRPATPAPAGTARYVAEGFGATSADSTKVAIAVLAGREPTPARPEDEQARTVVHGQRAAVWAARCASA